MRPSQAKLKLIENSVLSTGSTQNHTIANKPGPETQVPSAVKYLGSARIHADLYHAQLHLKLKCQNLHAY